MKGKNSVYPLRNHKQWQWVLNISVRTCDQLTNFNLINPTNNSSDKAVSYTHLDVYKRQHIHTHTVVHMHSTYFYTVTNFLISMQRQPVILIIIMVFEKKEYRRYKPPVDGHRWVLHDRRVGGLDSSLHKFDITWFSSRHRTSRLCNPVSHDREHCQIKKISSIKGCCETFMYLINNTVM